MTPPLARLGGPAAPVGVGALARLGLLGLGWGLHIVLTKTLGADGLTEALALLVGYMVLACAGLVGLAAVRSRRFRVTRAHLLFFVISGLLGYLGPILLELWVAPQIDAALFSLIAALTAVMTLALAVALGQTRATPRLAAALMLGLGSALLLLAPRVAVGGDLSWVLLAFLLPLIYALDHCYVAARWPRDLDPLQVAAAESVVALAIGVGLAAACGVTAGEVADIVGRGGAVLGLLALVAVGSIWLFFALLERQGAVFVSFASFVTVATGVVGGIALFGETPGLTLWLALPMTLAALWLLRPAREIV